MRRRTFLLGAIGAGWVAGQESGRAGDTLAYGAAGSLWILDLPDGRARQVASGAGIASPRISPSGQWIAYHQGERAQVVAREGGAPAGLGTGAAQWRFGRDELLMEEENGLSVFSAANGWASPVRWFPDAALPVVFSPDGGVMVYPRRTPAENGLLCRVDAGAALPAKTILARAGDGLIPYAWLGGATGDALWYWVDPDFSGSAESDGLELFRIPASGGTPRSLGLTTLVHDDFLALSPAGDRLAVTVGGDRRSWHNKRIALIDLASGAVHDLTSDDTVGICPAWSPDGTRVAFTALPQDASELWGGEPARQFLAKRRIWVANATGSSPPARLTGDDRYRDEQPAFLADGRHILFCRIANGPHDSNAQSIWQMDDHGGGMTQIAGPLQANQTFEGESWFGYYGTIDWGASMDLHRSLA
ncbi:MAG TPA: hypothetical protein VME43_23365 [Bryobacteraceae bacterium]|nr:hypothetical protein [Bryobacteraceae bacterium]